MDDRPHAITFWQALQLLLIGLKLTGQINWGWFFVLLPALWSIFLFAVDMIPDPPPPALRPNTFRR
jgi:hypothetical protein